MGDFFNRLTMFQNKNFWIGVLIILVIAGVIYYFGKKAGKKLPLPNGGSGIPQGWSPVQSAERLYAAMDGLGTDEDAIWNVLADKTPDQLAAIYNEYQHRFGQNLFDDFKGDLDDQDLARAMQFFQGVI